MELDEIRSKIKENMINMINDVLNNKEKSVTIHYVRPDDVISHLESMNNGERIDTDMDTNGWQWDYWMTINFKDKNYMISGDGYYQDYLTFSLKE